MKRDTITLNAPTTTGGKVISASSAMRIDGVNIALEGDKAFCPVCKREGTIRCDGPRLGETYCGKNAALDGDLCVCGCPVPPKLIAAQTVRSQNLGGGGADAWAQAVAAAKAVHAEPEDKRHAGKAVFVNEGSARPVATAPFTTSGKRNAAPGVTGGDGTGRL